MTTHTHTDPATISRILRTLNASLPAFGRKGSGDSIRLDQFMLDPELTDDVLRKRYLVPVFFGSTRRWHMVKLVWNTDGEWAAVLPDGADSLDALLRQHSQTYAEPEA